MKRTFFFDHLFPTRSTSSIHGLVERVFPMQSRPRVPDAVCLLHPWSRPSLESSIQGIVILIFALGLAFTGTAFANSWETSTMRAPGGGLVRIGMSRQEVLKELGQPLRTRATARNTATGEKSAKKNSAWNYRADDGLYTITFSGEQVVKIVVTPKRD